MGFVEGWRCVSASIGIPYVPLNLRETPQQKHLRAKLTLMVRLGNRTYRTWVFDAVGKPCLLDWRCFTHAHAISIEFSSYKGYN